MISEYLTFYTGYRRMDYADMGDSEADTVVKKLPLPINSIIVIQDSAPQLSNNQPSAQK